ncbi:MAG: esterase/lipase family protein [Microcoleus sp.]
MNSEFQRNPVVLVHGIFRKSGVFRQMSAYLTDLGWSVRSLDMTPNYGSIPLDRLALQLSDYITKTFPPDRPVDLVGLSMGGLVSRYYLQRLGGIDRVQRFVAISSPHNGTWMAYALWGTGCVQMRPNSTFLQDLNRDAMMLDRVNFTSIWTPWDFIIVPASSSQIPAGKEVKLPIFAHAMMARDLRSLQAVAEALAAPAKIGN